MTDRITGTKPGFPDYGLDELVLSGVTVHMERMASGHMWMRVYRPGFDDVVVNLHSTRKITANVEFERDAPHSGTAL